MLQNNTLLIYLHTTGARTNFTSNSTLSGCTPLLPDLMSPAITLNTYNAGAHTISSSKTLLEVLLLTPKVEDTAHPGTEIE